MMKRFFKVHAFRASLNGAEFNPAGDSSLGLMSACWDGRDLVLLRGLQVDRPPLYAELVDGCRLRFELVLSPRSDGEEEIVKAWVVEYASIVDRGFDWLNATVEAFANEAVALRDARLVPCKP